LRFHRLKTPGDFLILEEESKFFFSEEKKQKTFASLAARR